ncbi:aldo/keto reductase [uncultured Helicobacter sp.]|uniref:aldo/keto reductase n=1 Tax=uncultured Helicobacter sp. TaxID=175537 RepID=UPI002634BAE4|nr:aldo/keto reductase [uncultured Helicobacter sp.]
MQELSYYNGRRDFLKQSAILMAGVSAFGLSPFFADSAKKGEVMIQTLNNGVKMPIIGLGTYSLLGKDCERAILDALKVGYRAFDTAQMYKNEAEIGNAIKKSGFKREEIFITTKLSSDMSYEATKKSIENSLKALKLDYVDLLLLHRAYPQARQMYKAMEEFYKEGKIKALGISNFDTKVYLDFVKSVKVIPAVNQVQVNVFFQREELQKAMQKHKTIMQAWSPFAKGEKDFFNNETLKNIGKKYNKSVAQVGLRYLIERGINVIPKSSKKERMAENLNIFDFSLSSADMAAIKTLDTNKSIFGWDV